MAPTSQVTALILATAVVSGSSTSGAEPQKLDASPLPPPPSERVQSVVPLTLEQVLNPVGSPSSATNSTLSPWNSAFLAMQANSRDALSGLTFTPSLRSEKPGHASRHEGPSSARTTPDLVVSAADTIVPKKTTLTLSDALTCIQNAISRFDTILETADRATTTTSVDVARQIAPSLRALRLQLFQLVNESPNSGLTLPTSIDERQHRFQDLFPSHSPIQSHITAQFDFLRREEAKQFERRGAVQPTMKNPWPQAVQAQLAEIGLGEKLTALSSFLEHPIQDGLTISPRPSTGEQRDTLLHLRLALPECKKILAEILSAVKQMPVNLTASNQ